MTDWTIELTLEGSDEEHMQALVKLTQQYLEAAMEHTRRHDAKLTGVRLIRMEEPHAAHDTSTH